MQQLPRCSRETSPFLAVSRSPVGSLTKIGGFSDALRNAQDNDLYLRISRQSPFVWSKRTLAMYRLTPNGISSRSAIQLVQSKLAILYGLPDLPLTFDQTSTVWRCIAANLAALGWACGHRGQVRQSLQAYRKAFVQRPSPAQLRGAAGSMAKALLMRQRHDQ